MRQRFHDDEVFVENSTYPRHRLKERLLKFVKYECEICKNDGTWLGKRISLHLDHRNGVHNDNRRENLRFLCPNCHAQTETYAGKNSTGMRCPEKVKPNFRVLKLERDREKWMAIKPSIEIGKYGWQVQASQLIGITPQKVTKWLQRVDPMVLRELV